MAKTSLQSVGNIFSFYKSSMNKIWIVFVDTLKYFFRKHIYIVLWVIFVLSFVFYGVMWNLTLWDSTKWIIDSHFFILEFTLLVFVLLFGYLLVHQEKESKTIYLHLSKNIKKNYLIIWKFLWVGFLISVVVLVFVLQWAILYYAYYLQYSVWLLIQSYILIRLKYLILLSIIMFFATFASGLTSVFVFFAVYFLWHSSQFLHRYISSKDFGIITQTVSDISFFVLPSLDSLSISSFISFGSAIGAIQFISLIISSLLYIVTFLIISIVIYQKKS